MSIDRRQFLLLAALACCMGGVRAAAPLRFGVVPYLTARRLASLYEPARAFFANDLARPVQFSTAPDYAVHLERLRKREYDLVADSLPIARLAQRELGYVPLARTLTPLQPILVTAQGNPLRSLDQLRGRAVTVSDRIAALTVVGLRFLRDNGLQPGKEVAIHISGSHANAIQRVLAGEADAAIVSRTTLKQIEPALAARVRLAFELPEALSAVVYTAAPALATQVEGMGRRLIEFAAADTAGKAFIAALGHQGLVKVGREMEQVDPLVVEFYRQFNSAD
jgi:ABC-type phosphate/phosphonate transport system substrate-binding protein